VVNQTFSIGNVLATGFRVWIKNLVPFFFLSLVISAPLILWGVSILQGSWDLEQIQTFLLVSVVAGIAIDAFVTAALTFGVVKELQGQHATFGSSLATGLARLLPTLGVAILVGLAVLGGFLALIIPGIIILCMLYVSTPASVIERPGLLGALGRSRALTAGHRVEIFGIIVLIFAFNYGVSWLMGKVITDLESLMYANMVQGVLRSSLGAVMAAVAYATLRSEKEGTSAAELARVFE
jgi:hypothetical protein